MNDREKTRDQLLAENEALRRRVAALENSDLERRRAVEELAIFRKFADASSQGFSMADLDGRLTYLNPALCRMLGAERPEDCLGRHLSICYSEESNRQGKAEIEPVLREQGYWEGELPLRRRQGKSLPTWHNAFLIRDERGNPLRLAVVITDITERKRAQELLRQSHDELQAIYDGIADGIAVFDNETSALVRANAAISQMLGYAADELGKLTTPEIHPPEALPQAQEYRERVAQGQAAGCESMPFLRRDGSVCCLDVLTRPILYDGRPCRISFFHDVSDRKQAHEALERQHQTLKHLLQSSDHERQVIAYEIHDGLAQQLAAAIMQFDAFDHLKDTRPKQAADAFNAAMTMLRQGHLEARRLISGVRPPILDEAGIVAAVSHLVNEEKRQRGLVIEYLAKVEFNRLAPILENAIYRIIQEALANACRHSGTKKIHVELVQRGDQIQIEVRDRGVGFKPEQVGESRFGLEGIRERARLLGGKAAIETKLGHGTTVVVELPIVLRGPEDRQPNQAEPGRWR